MLTIQNLLIRYNDKILVNDVSIEIERGEIFALVGESGSGKSLTCLSVLSLLPEMLSINGRVFYNDREGVKHNISQMTQKMRSEYALNKIAYVFQEPLSALNPVQTCGKQLLENISLCGIKGKKESREKADDLLRQVELKETDKIMNAYPFQLSGGQRQRVMIAMALAGNPDLIIADEPTTALDVIIQDEILKLLQKICKEQNKSVLLVSHDIDAVQKFSDRIAVMYQGEIVEAGYANQIIKEPQHAYTKALIACKPRPDKKGKYLSTLSDEMGKIGHIPATFETEQMKDECLVELYQTGKDFYSNGKTYIALDDVSFQIAKGSSVGLIGESGSGKSTVSRLLVQLELPNRGHIKYHFKNNSPISSNVQMIFQDPFAALNPALTVESMLSEVIKKHSHLNTKQIIQESISLLEKVGLDKADLKKYPSQFSGGQRQRLCIARALAAKPILLICDESTSALDLSVQAQILNLLKSLQISEQLSILMVTHSMAVAAWFCNYLVVLKDGQVVEQGLSETILNHPKEAYTKTMISHV